MLHLLGVESCDDVVKREDSGDRHGAGVVVRVRRSEVANGRWVDGPLYPSLGVPEWQPFGKAE